MSQPSVFCIAASRDRVDRMVRQLKQHKFPGAEISILFLDRRAIAPEAAGSGSLLAARSARGMRGALRWIKGMGRLAIRSVRPLIDADSRAIVLRGQTSGGSAPSDRSRQRFAAGGDDIFTIIEVTTTKLSLLNALGMGCAART